MYKCKINAKSSKLQGDWLLFLEKPRNSRRYVIWYEMENVMSVKTFVISIGEYVYRKPQSYDFNDDL